MSIYLVDNFELGVSKPIDNRFVVGPGFFYPNRDSINNKYVGLRVWDTTLSQSFVWNGTTWLSESSGGGGGGTVGPGTVNRISRFITSSTIGDSIISQLNSRIGVNNNDPQYELDVNGRVYCSTGFIGNGSQITSINASNISSGNLPLERLSGGGDNNVLVGSTGAPSWISLSTLNVDSSNRSILSTSSDNTNHYLLMSSGLSGAQSIRTSNQIIYNPSNGNMGLSTTSNLNNNKLTINGSVAIGGDSIIAPENGLLVQGPVVFKTVVPIPPGQESSRVFMMWSQQNNVVEYSNISDISFPGSVPIGAIMMWSGIADTIPTGWGICDGTTYGSVVSPDLRQKFIFSTGDGTGVSYPTNQNIGQIGTVPVGEDDGASNTITFYTLAFIIYTGPRD